MFSLHATERLFVISLLILLQPPRSPPPPTPLHSIPPRRAGVSRCLQGALAVELPLACETQIPVDQNFAWTDARRARVCACVRARASARACSGCGARAPLRSGVAEPSEASCFAGQDSQDGQGIRATNLPLRVCQWPIANGPAITRWIGSAKHDCMKCSMIMYEVYDDTLNPLVRISAISVIEPALLRISLYAPIGCMLHGRYDHLVFVGNVSCS